MIFADEEDASSPSALRGFSLVGIGTMFVNEIAARPVTSPMRQRVS